MDAAVVDVFCGVSEGLIVEGEAIRISARGGIRFMDGKPFVRLFVGVIMEFMIDTALAEGGEEGAADGGRELAGVEGDVEHGKSNQCSVFSVQQKNLRMGSRV